MIMELYGLPGSGKSTLARQVEAKNYQVIKIDNRWELFYLNVLFLFKNPGCFFYWLYLIFVNKVDSKLFYYKFLNAFLYRNAKYIKAQKISKTIIDEGFFQNTLSFFENSINEDFLIKFVAKLPRPDLLVVFNMDETVITNERFESKLLATRLQFGDSYVVKWKSVLLGNNRLFLNYIQTPYFSSKQKIIFIKNEKDIEDFLLRI